MVILNTQTEVRIAYSRQTRDIYLVYGEALFEVEKDSTRPFRVFAGNALMQAVGTAFNVRRNTGDATVTVVEGMVDVSLANGKNNAGIASRRQADSVKVAPVRLAAGHQAVVQENSGRINVMSADSGKVLAWRQRRLVFDSETLASAVAEFNRYNRAKMVISDGELNNVLVSGVFSANDRESFAQFLQAARLAEFKVGYDSVIVLSGRNPDLRNP